MAKLNEFCLNTRKEAAAIDPDWCEIDDHCESCPKPGYEGKCLLKNVSHFFASEREQAREEEEAERLQNAND